MVATTRDEEGGRQAADEEVRVFLRTPLFSAGAHPHVPPGTFILEGRLREGRGLRGGVVLRVSRCLDETARPLGGGAGTLFLPLAKIDHISFLDAGNERGNP